MPRVNYVKKARKDQGRCSKCGDEIKAGDPYRHWSFRYGGKRKRCMKASCSPRQSDLTQSKLAGAYAAIEDAEDSIDAAGTLSDIAEALQSAAEGVRDVAQEYQDAAESQRDYFPDSPIADENEERAQELEWFADDLENKGSEIDGEDLDLDEAVDEARDVLSEMPY
jgi:hypothetical protein